MIPLPNLLSSNGGVLALHWTVSVGGFILGLAFYIFYLDKCSEISKISKPLAKKVMRKGHLFIIGGLIILIGGLYGLPIIIIGLAINTVLFIIKKEKAIYGK